MKKLYFFFIVCLVAVSAYAQEDPRTIKMVTYFPVPYVAYNTLDVLGRCDVGMLQQCTMDVNGNLTVSASNPTVHHYGKLGQASSNFSNEFNNAEVTFGSGRLLLNVTADYPTTKLRTVLAKRIVVGINDDDNFLANGRLYFNHKLIINSLDHQNMAVVADNGITVNSLKLKLRNGNNKKDFEIPACNPGGTNHNIQWQELVIDGESGIFLQCAPN